MKIHIISSNDVYHIKLHSYEKINIILGNRHCKSYFILLSYHDSIALE